jgi:hypothetical protein
MILEVTQATSAGGRLSIPVPWRAAEALQSRLRRRGVGSTVRWDPHSGAARLDLWPGADLAKVQEILDNVGE